MKYGVIFLLMGGVRGSFPAGGISLGFAEALGWGGQLWSYGFLLILVVLAPVVLVIRRCCRQKAIDRSTRQDLERCLKLLEFDPRNGAAYLRLAEIYEKVGDYDRAIEALHTVMQMNLADPGAEFRLNRLLQKKRREELGLVVCSHCGGEQPRGPRLCPSCGKRLRALP